VGVEQDADKPRLDQCPFLMGIGRRRVTALKMGQLPIFNLHGSKHLNPNPT
jgi:hypothetical protein